MGLLCLLVAGLSNCETIEKDVVGFEVIPAEEQTTTILNVPEPAYSQEDSTGEGIITDDILDPLMDIQNTRPDGRHKAAVNALRKAQ